MILIEDNDKNENSDVVKDQAKQMLKKMGKIVAKKSVIILIPIIIGLLLISAMTWFIVKDDGTWTDKETGNPSTYTKNVKLSGTDGISIDKMELIKKALSDMGYTNEKIESMDESEIIRILQMNMKLNKTVTSIEGCTIAEILWCINSDYSKYLKKPEDLEYLLNAEIVTQYPKIDGIADDKLNGIIEFARVSDLEDTNDDGVINIDDKPQKITYISQEDFDTKFQNYIDSGDKEVFNYYTLDESENVIIATWSEEDGNFESNNTALQSQQKIKGGHTESTIQSEYDERYKVNENTTEKITASYVTYSATKTAINYKSNVQKYTLPFEYLWALLIMGESDEFVLNLAELAYNSQIVVGVYDSITTTVIVNTNKYTENFREREERYENGVLVRSTEWTDPPESYSYSEINTITTKNDSVQFDIMYANVWIVEVISNYKMNKTQDNFSPEETIIQDKNWLDNGSNTEYSHYTKSVKDPKTGTNKSKTIFVRTEYFKQKKTTGQSYKTTQNIYYDKYEKVETKVREKTDIDPATDMNFVKLLRADQNANAMLFKPINVVWLCDDILANNADTANMVELTKYLINKAKNPDDTSLSFDFSIFEPDSFNEISSTKNLSSYLRQFSHSGEAPKSADGKYYKMYGDGKGWPTIGNADLQWKSHHSKFKKAGMVLKNGVETQAADVEAYVNSYLTRGAEAEYTNEEIDNYNIYVEVELVDEIGDSVQDTYYKIVCNATSGLNLSRQQLYALTAIAYNFGHLPERNGYTFKSVYEAGLAKYEANSANHNKFIWDNWWSSLGGGSAGHIPARDAAFETYVKGIYDFSQSAAGTVFSRRYYIYYTQEQINKFSYAPRKTITRSMANEEEIFTYEEALGAGILDAAEMLHKKLEDEKWSYSLTGLYTNDIEKSINHPQKITCCATFVSGVLYMSGYATEEEINSMSYNSSNGIYNFMKSRGDCVEIKSYNDLQEGDIVFMRGKNGSGIGHVQIYAGDSQWYNAGSEDYIRKASPYTDDTSNVTSRFITALRIE